MKPIRRVDTPRNSPAETAFTTVVGEESGSRDLAIYEKFGPDLRSFLRDCPVDVSATEVANVLAFFASYGPKGAETMTIQFYAEEVRVWNKAYRDSFDQPGAPAPDTKLIPTGPEAR